MLGGAAETRPEARTARSSVSETREMMPMILLRELIEDLQCAQPFAPNLRVSPRRRISLPHRIDLFDRKNPDGRWAVGTRGKSDATEPTSPTDDSAVVDLLLNT